MPPQNQNQFVKVPPDHLLPKPRGHHFLLIITFLLFLTGAFGVWYFLNLQPDLEPENLSTISKSDEFADWKTYRNEEYGFEFKYPNDWVMSPPEIEPNSITDIHKEGSTMIHDIFPNNIYFTISTEDLNLPLLDWTKKNGRDEIKNETFTIDGKVGIKQYFIDEITEENSVVFYIHNKNSVITLSAVGQDVKTLNEIFSTFKFISTSTSIIECAYNGNSYEPVDKYIANKIKNDSEVVGYLNEGYTLQSVCKSNNKSLAIFDFSDGYWKASTKIATEEGSGPLSPNIMIGVMDKTFDNKKFYKIDIPNYRYEGTGGMACNFDKISGDNILFICANAGDGGSEIMWYAYNITNNQNTKVKYRSNKSWEDSPKEEVYNYELLNLFSYK